MLHLEQCQRHVDGFIAALQQAVDLESPSHQREAVNRLGDYLSDRFGQLGARLQRVPAAPFGDHLLMDYGSGDGQPVLILCHMDTVFPLGSTAGFSREGNHLRGPGVLDMKGGIILLLYALHVVADMNLQQGRWRVLINSDEEIGSPSSRALIEQEALRSRHVLVLEPGIGPEGRIKVARKGVAQFSIEVTGRAAHAGSDPGAGVSAVVELAHQILALHALNDPVRGTTVNVAPIAGGTASNVVAERAHAQVDVRIAEQQQVEPVLQALRSLRPLLPEVELKVSGGLNRPPMECSPRMAEMALRAQLFAQELGFDLQTGMTGGGSDGNFTAALGVPTLDGLGLAGEGAHSQREYARLDSVVRRMALLVRILTEL